MTASMARATPGTPHAARPRMAQRSISDFSPVCDMGSSTFAEGGDANSNSSGNGGDDWGWNEPAASASRAHVGGIKVVSGGRLATGGSAPYSPFLPLAPALSLGELRDRYPAAVAAASAEADAAAATELSPDATPRLGSCGTFGSVEHDRPHTPEHNIAAAEALSTSPTKRQRTLGAVDMSPSSSGSSNRTVTLLRPAAAVPSNGLTAPASPAFSTAADHLVSRLAQLRCRGPEYASRTQPRSACMIRSYSVPVATQAEFERQARLSSYGAADMHHDDEDDESDAHHGLHAAGWPSSFAAHRLSLSESPRLPQSAAAGAHSSSNSNNAAGRHIAPLGSPRKALMTITNDASLNATDSHLSAAEAALLDDSADDEAQYATHDGKAVPTLLPGLSPSRSNDRSRLASSDTDGSHGSSGSESSGACTPRAYTPVRGSVGAMRTSRIHAAAASPVCAKTAAFFGSSQGVAGHEAFQEKQRHHTQHPLATFIHPDHF